jgi:hypothetical protein
MGTSAAIHLLKRLYLWNIDAAVRYRPVVQLLRRAATPASHVLEIGSGPYGVTLFWPRQVVGYDVDFSGPDLGCLQRVKAAGDGGRLPFADRQFDFVLSLDTLEHVPPAGRAAMIAELVRVTRRWLVVSAPCGAAAAQYDAKLEAWLREHIRMEHRWLGEHFQHGLPEAAEIEDALRRAFAPGESYALVIEDNGDLRRWLLAWKLHMSRNRFWRSLKSKLLWPFAGWFAAGGRGPAYRKVFVVERRGQEQSVLAAPMQPVQKVAVRDPLSLRERVRVRVQHQQTSAEAANPPHFPLTPALSRRERGLSGRAIGGGTGKQQTPRSTP